MCRMLPAMDDVRPEPAPGASGVRLPKPAGRWVVYLIFAMTLVWLIIMDAGAISGHQWTEVAGVTAFALLFVIVPTGGWRHIRGALTARTPPS